MTEVDIHELLKKLINDDLIEVKKNSDEEIQDIKLIDSYKNNKYIIHYLYLDRNFALNSSSGNGFKFLLNYGNRNFNKGYINIDNPVFNVKAVRLSNVNMLYTPKYVTQYDNYNDYKITVLIEELQVQAFMTNTGNKFHFIGDIDKVEYVSDIRLYPHNIRHRFRTYDFNDGWFIFDNPVQVLDSITITIMNESNMLNFAYTTQQTIVSSTFYTTQMTMLYITPIISKTIYFPLNQPTPLYVTGFESSSSQDVNIVNAINTVHERYISMLCRSNHYGYTFSNESCPLNWDIQISSDSSYCYKITLIQDQLLSQITANILKIQYNNGVIISSEKVLSQSFTIGTISSILYNAGLFNAEFSINNIDFTFTVSTNTVPSTSQTATLQAVGNLFHVLTNDIEQTVILLYVDSSTMVGTSIGVTNITAYNSPLNMNLEILCEEQ